MPRTLPTGSPSAGSLPPSGSSTSHPSLTFKEYKQEVRRIVEEDVRHLTEQQDEARARNDQSLVDGIQLRLEALRAWENAQTRKTRAEHSTQDNNDQVGNARGFLSQNLALVGALFLHVPFEQNLRRLMVSPQVSLRSVRGR